MLASKVCLRLSPFSAQYLPRPILATPDNRPRGSSEVAVMRYASH